MIPIPQALVIWLVYPDNYSRKPAIIQGPTGTGIGGPGDKFLGVHRLTSITRPPSEDGITRQFVSKRVRRDDVMVAPMPPPEVRPLILSPSRPAHEPNKAGTNCAGHQTFLSSLALPSDQKSDLATWPDSSTPLASRFYVAAASALGGLSRTLSVDLVS